MEADARLLVGDGWGGRRQQLPRLGAQRLGELLLRPLGDEVADALVPRELRDVVGEKDPNIPDTIHIELILEAEVEKEDKEEKAGKYIRQERHYGKMMRRFNLGEDVKEKDIEARFKDGVLKLKAPKLDVKTVAKERRIAIH